MQHKDGFYIHGAKVKLLMRSIWKQATLLFLMHVQICYFISPQTGIHSFIQQKFIECSYVSGTVSGNEDTVVGGEKDLCSSGALLSGEGKKDK